MTEQEYNGVSSHERHMRGLFAEWSDLDPTIPAVPVNVRYYVDMESGDRWVQIIPKEKVIYYGSEIDFVRISEFGIDVRSKLRTILYASWKRANDKKVVYLLRKLGVELLQPKPRKRQPKA